jgi:uncharacterized membrane protein
MKVQINWLRRLLDSLPVKSAGWRSLLILVLLLGIGLRFVHLERKPYWVDETYTSLRVSGQTEAELVKHVYTGKALPVAELQQFQQINPQHSLRDTLRSLATDSPQHPPLYFALARFWTQWFGNGVVVSRSLPAVLSLLLLPAMYWLSWELLGTSTAGWAAVLLVAVSPFHLLYAQEARPYSLWAVAIACASAALIRALRQEQAYENNLDNLRARLKAWGLYAATVVLMLYSFLFSIFVLLAHAIYVVTIARWSKATRAFLWATLAGFVTFLPWLAIVLTNWSQFRSTTAWTTKRIIFGHLLQSWLVNTGNVFVDGNWGYRAMGLPTVLALVLVAYAFYRCIRQTERSVWLFIVLLTLIPALCLIVPDVMLGGIGSTRPRYFTPSWIGVELAVAYLLGTNFNQRISHLKPWRLVLLVVLVAGLVSNKAIVTANSWWNKSPSKHRNNTEIAALLNQSARPLLISDDATNLGSCFACRMLSLSHLLKEPVHLQLVRSPNIPTVPTGFSDVFLLSSDPVLRQKIEQTQGYRSEPVKFPGPLPNDSSTIKTVQLWRMRKEE